MTPRGWLSILLMAVAAGIFAVICRNTLATSTVVLLAGIAGGCGGLGFHYALREARRRGPLPPGSR